MPFIRILTLFGSQTAKETAKIALENQPFVRRMDLLSHPYELRLVTDSPLHDINLVSLLSSSGISGFKLK